MYILIIEQLLSHYLLYRRISQVTTQSCHHLNPAFPKL